MKNVIKYIATKAPLLWRGVGVRLFVLVFLSTYAHAQIEVHAVLDSSKIRIGEQTRLDIYLSYDAAAQKNINIQWPQIEDTLKKEIEVLNITKIDTTIPDKARPNFIQQHIQLTITSFDSGYYAIPPFEFVLNNDTANKLLTEALLLEVNSVPTDTSAAKIKDIKAPFNEPFDWKWYLPYVYIGLAILAVILIIILIVRRIKKNKPVEVIPEKPKTPAHITAFASLEKIKEEAIWKDLEATRKTGVPPHGPRWLLPRTNDFNMTSFVLLPTNEECQVIT